MKATTILQRCREAEDDMARLMQRIKQRRMALESVTPKMDTIGGGHGSGEPDRLGELIAAIDELSSQHRRRLEEQRVEVVAACALLDDLPDTECAVMYQYYVQRRNVPGIAKRLGYAPGYIRKLKSKAESTIREVPESRVAQLLPAWYLRGKSNTEERR